MSQTTTCRINRAALLVASLIHLGGCATSPPKPESQPLSEYDRARVGYVLLVPNYETEEATRGVNWSKGLGAAKGAGRASLDWVGAALQTGDPLTAVVGIALTPVAAVAGGVYGGVVADKSADVEQQVHILNSVFADTSTIYAERLQDGLHTAEHLPSQLIRDTALPPEHSPGAYLEINFRALHGSGEGPKSELHFSLLTDTRLYLENDPYPVFERTYVENTPQRRLSAWAAGDGEALRAAIATLTDRTVDSILNDYFLRSPYTVVPVHPVKNYMFKPARIDTSRPEFRWKMYEGRHLVDMTENTTLSYEVRVASASGEVWRVGDIKDFRYELARGLPGCGTYAWQVRANYDSLGARRSTPWSMEKRFRTRCKKTSDS